MTQISAQWEGLLEGLTIARHPSSPWGWEILCIFHEVFLGMNSQVFWIVSRPSIRSRSGGCVCVCVCAAALKGAKKKKTHPDRKWKIWKVFRGMSPKVSPTPRAMLYHYRKKKKNPPQLSTSRSSSRCKTVAFWKIWWFLLGNLEKRAGSAGPG